MFRWRRVRNALASFEMNRWFCHSKQTNFHRKIERSWKNMMYYFVFGSTERVNPYKKFERSFPGVLVIYCLWTVKAKPIFIALEFSESNASLKIGSMDELMGGRGVFWRRLSFNLFAYSWASTSCWLEEPQPMRMHVCVCECCACMLVVLGLVNRICAWQLNSNHLRTSMVTAAPTKTTW